jgi:hypothetical protein
MIQLRCTQKMLKELGLKTKELAQAKTDNSPLGNWYAHLITLDRRKAIVFVNERTLANFIIYGVKHSNLDKISKAFVLGVAQVLLMMGADKEQIAQILQDYTEVEFTKTIARDILGYVNSIAGHYKESVRLHGGLKYCDLDEIIFLGNQIPLPKFEHANAIELTRAILNDLKE